MTLSEYQDRALSPPAARLATDSGFGYYARTNR
jgi:hypothetical protein